MQTVDLEQCRVFDAFGLASNFETDTFRRDCLLNGLDEIALTLKHEGRISKYEARRAHVRRFSNLAG